MSFRDRPIASKLRLVITSACVVVVALTCAAFVAFEWFSYRAGLLEATQLQARMLASTSAASLAFNNPTDAGDLLGALSADHSTLAGVLYDAAGGVFAAYGRPVPPELLAAVPTPGHVFSADSLAVRVPVELQSHALGSLVLQQSLLPLTQRMQLYALLALVLMLLSSALAYVLAGRLQRVFSRPVLALADSAHAVAERQDYTRRAEKVGADEIGFLTDAFNAMLDRIQDNERILEARVAARTGELQAANQELEAFCYSVSHDLRSPLRIMMGMAEIALEDHGPGLPGEVAEHLRTIARNGQRMTNLINDLLNFAQQGRQKPVIAEVDMDALARSVLADFADEIATRGVVVHVAPLAPCCADAAMVRQVLDNLVGNALKYTRQRAPAVIELGPAPASEPRLAGYFVRDNGVGFDMKYAAKLFEPFQRLHAASQFEGTGVGLAIAQRIVQRHGGRIRAQAEPDRGATFFFTLPAIGPGVDRASVLPS